jgi:predicted TIM-barrel fold metal-dependent hydrolase
MSGWINRRKLMMLLGGATVGSGMAECAQQTQTPIQPGITPGTTAGAAPYPRPDHIKIPDPLTKDMTGINADALLLRDYRPVSVYKVPVSYIPRARYPVTDMHCHGVQRPDQVDSWVKVMDDANIEKATIFTQGADAKSFNARRAWYSKYPDRFQFFGTIAWPGIGQQARTRPEGGVESVLKGLEEIRNEGALGLGELSGVRVAAAPELAPIWDKCGALGLVVELHPAVFPWQYLPPDNHNDGLMNGYFPGPRQTMADYEEIMQAMDRWIGNHPKTTFLMCHLAGLPTDLTRLGGYLDKHPNMFVENSAEWAEVCTTPRATLAFYQKYSDRVLFGTDIPYHPRMFATAFRIMESFDEHFYEQDLFFNFNYHWPLYGLGLPDDALKKLYRDNARALFARAQSNAR